MVGLQNITSEFTGAGTGRWGSKKWFAGVQHGMRFVFGRSGLF